MKSVSNYITGKYSFGVGLVNARMVQEDNIWRQFVT